MDFNEALSLATRCGNVSALRPARFLSPAMVQEIESKSLGEAIKACQYKKQVQFNVMTARHLTLGATASDVDIKQLTTTAATNVDDQISTTDIVASAWTTFTSSNWQIPDNRFVSMHGCYVGPAGSIVYDRLGHVRWKKGSEKVALWSLNELYVTDRSGGAASLSDEYAGYGEGYSVYKYPVWSEKDFITGEIYAPTGLTTANVPFKVKGWCVETGAQVVAPLRKADTKGGAA